MQLTFLRVCALLTVFATTLANAEPVNLFTRIVYSGSDNSPPPEDALAVFNSTLDVAGVAAMATEIFVSVPGVTDPIAATIHRKYGSARGIRRA